MKMMNDMWWMKNVSLCRRARIQKWIKWYIENNNITGAGYENMYTNLPISKVCFLRVASNILLLITFIKTPIKFFRNLSDNEPLSFRLCYKSMCSVFFSCTDNFFLCSWFYRLFCCTFFTKCLISIDYFNINWWIFYGDKHRIFVRHRIFVKVWWTAWLVLTLFTPFFKINFGISKMPTSK